VNIHCTTLLIVHYDLVLAGGIPCQSGNSDEAMDKFQNIFEKMPFIGKSFVGYTLKMSSINVKKILFSFLIKSQEISHLEIFKILTCGGMTLLRIEHLSCFLSPR